jgi:hypothetical protein
MIVSMRIHQQLQFQLIFALDQDACLELQLLSHHFVFRISHHVS